MHMLCNEVSSHNDSLERASSLVPGREEQRVQQGGGGSVREDRRQKKDEGVKKHAVWEVETSGW